MVGREKRPVLLKFGVALAISLGGILYTFFRAKKSKFPKPKPSQISPVSDSRRESHGIRNANHASQDSLPTKFFSPNSYSNASPSSRHSMDRDGYLLPEFNELIKETTDNISTRKNGELLVPDVQSPGDYRCGEYDDQIRELKSLRDRVKVFEERERILEIQLLEYYGLKEQESVVMELQNQLRLNDMEAKLYSLKIESLCSENRRLEAQVADFAKVVTELEVSKAMIKILRKKLRSDAEQNREQILILQERVMKLQHREKKAVEIDQGIEIRLQKCNELEKELEEMKKLNNGLKMENSVFAQKLEYVQMLGTTSLDNEEILELKEESRCLRQRNEDLTKEIDQLQADRCTDVEELVYLRWINACLRHELRNFKPTHGKTLARDLSKTLSPKSEEKAKKLILEYSNKEGGSSDKGLNAMEFDSEEWSSSQASYLTDSVESDDSPVDTLSVKKTNTPRKIRVFGKLMRLLRGKDSSSGHPKAAPLSSPLERAVSVDDVTLGRYSSESHPRIPGTDGLIISFTTSSEESSRHSFDLQRSYSRCLKSLNGVESSNCSQRNSDDSSLSIFRRINSITEDANDSSPINQPLQDTQTSEKSELIKYAEALKNSRMKTSLQRRSASYSSL